MPRNDPDPGKPGHLAGIHLEGPFLNPRYRGAHHTDFVLPPDVKALRHLRDAGADAVRVVTLAPELDGAIDLIRELVAAALTHDAVVCELINGSILLALKATGADRIAFVTDATSATGMRDRQFGLGPLQILAREGKVTLLDAVTNAGSTLTIDRAMRRAPRAMRSTASGSRSSTRPRQPPPRLRGFSACTGRQAASSPAKTRTS